MPRIDDGILDCATYLYRSVSDAGKGEEAGGSGFLLEVPALNPGHRAKGLSYAVCVTNRHVIELGATVVRLNSANEAAKTVVADLNESHWVFPADGTDLAVTTVPIDLMEAKKKRIPFEAILTKEAIAERGIGVGDDVFLVGRFINHDGGQENTPTARFGSIAQMAGKPLAPEGGGKPQESYLVECRSIGGFSGSPVFVQIQPFTFRPERAALTNHYFGPALLGVDWCHTFYKEPIMEASKRERRDGSYVSSHTGIMGVIPSWKLLELFDSPRFRKRVTTPMPADVYRFG